MKKAQEEPERRRVQNGHGCLGVKDQIRAEHPRDGARGSHHGDRAVDVGEDLSEAGRNTRSQVEERVARVADRVLHVVPEDVEKQDVAAEVQPTAVHEHAGEEREA
jgi:hypothetical protein